jgi:hypothetical protein
MFRCPRNRVNFNLLTKAVATGLLLGLRSAAYLGEAKMPEDRLLVIPAERLTFAPYPGQKVLVNIDFPSDRLGLAPGLHLAVEFTSAEARSVARALLRAADETEARKRAASPLYF